MTTNNLLRRREMDRLGPYVQQVALDKANVRIAELEAQRDELLAAMQRLERAIESLKGK